MRLTAALLATLTLLWTVFLAQAVPLTVSRNDAETCVSLTDCDSYAKEAHAGRLATSVTQCKKATAIHAAREWSVAAKADVVWTQIKAHTLDGRPDKADSGRHLTSTWFDHADNKGTSAHMIINAATGLAHVPVKKKTLWIDSDAEGKATHIAHKYTRNQVANICKAALVAGLNTGKSTESVTSGSYAVQTPWGNHICVTVSNVQCYPATTDATAAAPGEKC
ncbi:uncharacterized protein B0H18DRAFT_960132 [Fomitopsis serialis]|uniref:uncharacterized protein n=1 Tax=Fomitopsis serialis TaxID=139415 RepID=UPI002007C12A|nr:uncharacterized protein B0H18DRAFT_960132 [Neoantrodia serialis]KAH9913878.1 hypothetical protein B0H18DRAFT_960132 [Neoantrodia serialis]